jgi:GT2 family glycosyltransferase
LRLPRHDNPQLSVVMVTHGAWPLAEEAIGALIEHTQAPFELVIVDNASADGTAARIHELDGARVILNGDNLGFGPATNQGAQVARGEYLVLLNSDAFVHAGWLEPLLDAVQRPDVGAAVPRYLDRAGVLQEAGALLARDGTVHLYGEGDDANRGCYSFRRTVDYGSAVCMLIGRATFESLGGFDRLYAPAYYEDSDLCLRLAEQGKSVVYEPRSTVTHVRYGSGGLAEARKLSERNRKLFADRWQTRLAGRPQSFVAASDQAVILSRDALANPRLLICADLDRPPAQLVVDGLLRGFPTARLTLATSSDGARWPAQGVEILDDPDHSWLSHRLFHYDAVLRGDDMACGLRDAVARTQPQAPQVALHRLGPAAQGLAAALTAAGIAPPGRIAG